MENRTLTIQVLTLGYLVTVDDHGDGGVEKETYTCDTPTKLLAFVNDSLDLAVFDPMYDPAEVSDV